MANPERSPASRAVFLSYTTEDVAIALAVCEALREAGIEVWMDHSELQGGDAWDENIQRQIRECALIIPIISNRTQARREGYFRLEWRLADERMRLVAEGTPLIVPVVADDTRQAEALVPKSFLTVQWLRLPHGHVPPALVLRVRKLLGLEAPAVSATVPPVGISAAPVTAPVATPLLEPDEPATMRETYGTAAQPPSSWRAPLPVAVMSALAASIVVGLAVWKLRPAPEAESRPIVRFAQDLPPNVSFRNTGRTVIALSPDGRSFVYNTTAGLFIRTMSEMNAHAILGTENVLTNPVFSPDGQSIAFYAQGANEMRRISVTGGASIPIVSIENPGGMSWENDGSILYGQSNGIWRVPAAGNGKPEQIIPADEGERLSAPQLLPGGKFVLFSSLRLGRAHVEVKSLAGGGRKVVVPGGRSACYVPATSHLLYMAESDLFGVAFDLEHLATIGSPASMVPDVGLAEQVSMANYGISRDGSMLYLTGGMIERRVLVWVDRQGKEDPLKLEPGAYYGPRLSPDGAKIVMADTSASKRAFLVWDLAGETRTRLTLGEAEGGLPNWTPDGMRIIYPSYDGRMMAKAANNTRPPEVFLNAIEGGRNSISSLCFFTPDGRRIVFNNSGDIGSLPIGSAEKPTWLINSPQFYEADAALSPDGKWMAYYSNESGRNEIYVSPFPNAADDRVVVSKEGGTQPLWSRDGKELFYVGGTVFPAPLMAATVQSDGGKFVVAGRKPVWNSNSQTPVFRPYNPVTGRTFDISPDNQRFLVLKEVKATGAGERPEQIVIVQNWTEELKRRVPGARK